MALAGSFLLAKIEGIKAEIAAVNKPKPIQIGATHHWYPSKSNFTVEIR